MDKDKKNLLETIEVVRAELHKEILESKKQGDANLNRVAQDLHKKILALQEKVTTQEARLVAQGDKISAQEKELEAMGVLIKKQENELEALRANHPIVEDGEISNSINDELIALREQIKTLEEKEEKVAHETTSWAQVIQKTQKQVEDAGNWIEIAKKQRIPQSTPHIIDETLQEERRRRIRALHVRVTGLAEGTSPKEDAQALCTLLGVEGSPYIDAWRAGKDPTREKPLLLKFIDQATKQAFLDKRSALKGGKIYLGDDLTPSQVAHRRAAMVEVHEARKAGKWAVYRDGRVIISEARTK